MPRYLVLNYVQVSKKHIFLYLLLQDTDMLVFATKNVFVDISMACMEHLKNVKFAVEK